MFRENSSDMDVTSFCDTSSQRSSVPDRCDTSSPQYCESPEPPRKRAKKLQGLSDEEAERRRLQSNALVSTQKCFVKVLIVLLENKVIHFIFLLILSNYCVLILPNFVDSI